MSKKLNIWSIIYPFAAMLFIIAAWGITAKIIGQEIILPTISSTLKSMLNVFSEDKFFLRIGSSLSRCLIAFSISFILAIIFALLSKLVNPIRQVMKVFVLVLRAVPTMSFILFALIWLSSFNAPILVASIVLFPIMYGSILTSIESVDSNLIEMAQSYKIPILKQVRYMYLPQMQSQIFSIVRSNISFSIKLIIAAEVLAQTRDSIGVSMNNARLYFEMGDLFAWTIIAVVLASIMEAVLYLIELIVRKLQRRGVNENK